jgi:hypothetical protein
LIKQGDRVKLSARAAAAFDKACRGKFVWTDRGGVVLRITANKANAVVLWDGRTSREYLPIRAIEFALATGDSHRLSSRPMSASAEQSH